MTLNLKFTPQDWERLEHDWTAWWAGELERPMVVIERIEGYDQAPELLPDVVKRAFRFPLETPIEEIIAYNSRTIEQMRYYGDAFPRWYPDFGPGIMAGFLGARVKLMPDTVWFEPVEKKPIQELYPAFDPDNIWWQRVYDLTQAAVAHFGDQVSIAFTDLGGNLDILSSLHATERMLMEVIDAPDEVTRLTQTLTQLWLRYHTALWEFIEQNGRGSTAWVQMWSPGRFAITQSDFAYMISPEMFERWVLPDLEAITSQMDYSFYHLDGKGQLPHVDQLLALESLDGIQWIPGAGAPPPEEWLALLKRIRDGGKLCQVYVTPEGARAIVKELGGRGFCFVIFEGVGHKDANDFLKTLAQEDISQR